MDKTLAIILAASFVFAGLPMATGQSSSIEQGRHLGFSPHTYRLVGLVQLMGAAALAIGVFWAPLAIAAAVGFSLMMLGAVVTHLRAGDPAAKVFPAVVFGLASMTTVVLHLV